MKDLTEFRPMFRRVWRRRHTRCVARVHPPQPRCLPSPAWPASPDHVMVLAEEAYKRRQLKAGKPYTGKLPVRDSTNPMDSPRCAPVLKHQGLTPRPCRRVPCAAKQSPIPADRLPENKGKTPRIVRWKMDRLW